MRIGDLYDYPGSREFNQPITTPEGVDQDAVAKVAETIEAMRRVEDKVLVSEISQPVLERFLYRLASQINTYAREGYDMNAQGYVTSWLLSLSDSVPTPSQRTFAYTLAIGQAETGFDAIADTLLPADAAEAAKAEWRTEQEEVSSN